MPSYFYECKRCAKVFTEVRKIEQCDQPAIHPDCGTSTTKRVLMGPFSFTKGSARETSTRQARKSEPTGERPWTARIVNCEVTNCDTGVKLSGNARVQMDDTRLRGNRVGVDMSEESELRARRTTIE